MTTKAEAKRDVAMYKASTSIPRYIKVHLDSLIPQDERPPALSKWAREVFEASRKVGIQDVKTVRLMKEYAKEKGYSDFQISRVRLDNRYRE